ncbi:MAG: hypothetical protein GX081_07400 [Firmicutes bacterium]|nr:hypothetical protein [Bacillota bacterium]
MKGEEIRGLLATILFSAFTVIAVFFLLDPFIAETTETITVNTQKYYINLGWLQVYYMTLLITFVLMIFFMEKKQVWALILGLVLGSVPLLEQYRLPGVVRVLNVFNQSAASNLQTYIPYVAVFLGALVVFGLLKVTNRILK